ncbi:MAG: hypothetical protein DRO39_06840 [Thermoprotei archaeon]|nr:MAG: hypothetical protein DRO39_06840 [Thermoprotei archaeon]
MDSVSLTVIVATGTWIGTVIGFYRLYTSRLSRIEERLERIERQIATIMSDVQWLKNSRREMYESVNDVKQRLARLESDVAWLREQVNA